MQAFCFFLAHGRDDKGDEAKKINKISFSHFFLLFLSSKSRLFVLYPLKVYGFSQKARILATIVI